MAMDGIVGAGDRARASARQLRALRQYPPRDVPALALWSGAMHGTTTIPVALALTLAGIGFAAAAVFQPAPRDLPPWLPALFLLGGLVAWVAAAAQLRRARRLLESGMPARARITGVHVNLFMHSGGRSRATIAYDWTFAGQTGHAKAHGYIGWRDRALVAGEELDLLCDPSAPEDQLLPVLFGFRLENS